MANTQVPALRAGTVDDIPALAVHHRKMFEEIWLKKGILVDPSAMEILEDRYAAKLHGDLKNGTCIAWVISTTGRILASGAVSIFSYVPVPHDLSPIIAFLHSVYTEEDQRGQGYASGITREAVQFCRNNDICRLYLFASDEGRIVYEKEGFSPVDSLMMQLVARAGPGQGC